ncbi:MAG: type II toxin-antitoxin system VapC family toxin [Propionibacteriales bacterium]|nr:type II toxin-antitoxin system VapC family toxin [Propionibacteriales bacterium]
MPVLDASVVVEWISPVVRNDSPESRLLHRLAAADVPLHAPHLLIQEAGNALLTGVRRGRWTPAQADEAFGELDRLPLIRHAVNNDLERAWELARRYDEHPFYDMVYVAVAERVGDVLVTCDERLRQRIRKPGLVVSPDEWVTAG